MAERPRHILPLIILSQFLGTASWFAGNAALPGLAQIWQFATGSLALVTNAVQSGFILGALSFALLSLSDRFSPSKIFLVCALSSAAINLATALWADSITDVAILRFTAGLLLAGIYPVGMKLAASWFPEGLGRALGYLIGSLVLGTAIPHLFASFSAVSWQGVMIWVAIMNLAAGLIITLAVGDGPALAAPAPVRLRDIRALISYPKLRASALGYFGHMWELYAIWAIAPVWLANWAKYQQVDINVSLMTFCVIGIGALGSSLGGLWSSRFGSARIATGMLTISGACCLLSPIAFEYGIFANLIFWFIWGFSISADSAQFSALSAKNAPSKAVGTALTLINAIGFFLTLLAIQLSVLLLEHIPVAWIPLILLPGPILGVLAMRRLIKDQ